jgi:hypothetical protein
MPIGFVEEGAQTRGWMGRRPKAEREGAGIFRAGRTWRRAAQEREREKKGVRRESGKAARGLGTFILTGSFQVCKRRTMPAWVGAVWAGHGAAKPDAVIQR